MSSRALSLAFASAPLFKPAPGRRFDVRGFLPVLRHELRTGWSMPLLIAGFSALCAWQLAASHLVMRDLKLPSFIYMALVLTGAPLAVRRLLAEAENGSFLPSKPSTRLGGLLAKGAAASIDLALVAVPAWWLATQVESAIGAWAGSKLGLSRGLSLGSGMLMGLLATAAAGFGIFACLRSVWIAGSLTLLACFATVVLLGNVEDARVIEVGLLAIALVPLAAAVAWGSPSREGEN